MLLLFFFLSMFWTPGASLAPFADSYIGAVAQINVPKGLPPGFSSWSTDAQAAGHALAIDAMDARAGEAKAQGAQIIVFSEGVVRGMWANNQSRENPTM